MRYNRAGVWNTPALSAIFIWCNLEEKANMKKFLTLLLALVMALSIVGCGKTNTDEPQTPSFSHQP